MEKGQSIIEILIGVAVGALFLIGAAGVIAPALRTNQQVNQIQLRTQVANELMQNVRSWAAGNWSAVLSLATGTASHYYLSAASSSFFAIATSTGESVSVGTSTFVRYFFVDDVYRDASGYVTSTPAIDNYDPSTKLATVVVSASGSTSTISVMGYLIRTTNNAVGQADWSGSSGQTGPVTVLGTAYATSSNVTITASGTIQLAVPVVGTCQL